MNPTSRRVEVKLDELIAALSRLHVVQRSGRELRIAFNNGELELVRATTAVRIPALGRWALIAVVNVRIIRDLRRLKGVLPETLAMTGVPQGLRVGYYSAPCVWIAPNQEIDPLVRVVREPALEAKVTVGRQNRSARELLEAIAAAGGLEPLSVLSHLVSPQSAEYKLDLRDAFLREVLRAIREYRTPDRDAQARRLLSNARAATLAHEMTTEQRARRLQALDAIRSIILDDSPGCPTD